MARFKLILAVVLVALLIVVVLQNTETVDTRLLFVTVTMPRAALLLVTFLAGGLFGLLLATRFTSDKKKAQR
jgi:uncharacterized integral membrane protein